MNLMIKRMSPELEDDYFDFFDHRAFSDGSPYYPCYCNAFNMSAERIHSEIINQADMNGGGIEGWRLSLRSSAQKMVRQREIEGYLAYDGNIPVGWCNANDKNRYYRFGEFSLDNLPPDAEKAGESSIERVKSVVCFEIAPEYRGKGLATALLQRVCEDAAEDGFEYVEAYPLKREEENELDFTGPVKLYEKLGFTLFEQDGEQCTMRKKLK